MPAGKNPYHQKYQATQGSEESKEFQKFTYSALKSILTFIGFAFLGGSVAAGVGMKMWFDSGQNPDNSGGTLIFFYAGITSGLLGLIARCFTKRRAVLYGLTFFMWNTVLMMILMLLP